jgi:hypothetical protein
MPATVAGFAALTPDQQRTLMSQELDHYNSVLDQAYRTLDLSLLPQVLTGPELQTQQQQLGALKAKGTPGGGSHNDVITGIGVAPALGSVTVQVAGSDTSWWLNPTTLQPEGQPNTVTTPTAFTFVPEDGVWKVKLVVAL